MPKKISDHVKDITRALKRAGTYTPGVAGQIQSLAGALRSLDIANEEIDNLESTTISVVSRYGNETLAPHPAFKIQKDAQDSVTRQMKALMLTVEDLTGTDDTDPLIELTRKVAGSSRKAPVIVRPDK